MGKKYGSGDLIVGVTYYQNRASTVKNTCTAIENNYFKEYLNILNLIQKYGIKSGDTADLFVEYVSQVKAIEGLLNDFGELYSNTIKDFLEDIDNADDILFANKGRKILTEEEFNNAKGAARFEFSFEHFGEWLLHLVYNGPIGNILLDDSKQLAKRVKELEDITIQKLSRIEANVRLVDSTYNVRLRNIYKQIKKYENIINKLAYIMSPESNNLNKKNIAELQRLVLDVKKYQAEIINNPYVDTTSLDDIRYFAENIENYFWKSTEIIKSICESSIIGKLFLTEFDVFRATINDAKKYFDSFSKEYIDSKKSFDDAKKEFDELLEKYEKYGEAYEKYIDDKSTVKNFNKIIDTFKNLGGSMDKYIDIWYQMYFDMSESKNVLLRFKKNCDLSNPNIKKALERIEKLYDKEVDAYVEETYETFLLNAKEHGVKKAIQIVTEAISQKSIIAGKIVSVLAGKVVLNGYEEMKAIAMYDWVEETENAFENALTDLKNADKDDSDYYMLVKSVQEAFGAAKEARIDFFTNLIQTSSGDEKSYYEYCLKMMQTASLSDDVSLDLFYQSKYDGSNFNPLTDMM